MDPDQTWARIRQRVAGLRIVFVTNRVDKKLQKALSTLLGTKLTWVVIGGAPRKTSSLAKSIRQGTYAIVLYCNGWGKHKEDAVLSQAARRSETLYVRVGKGKPSTTMLALARDLGFD